MRSIFTHFLAVVLGVAIAFLWPKSKDSAPQEGIAKRTSPSVFDLNSPTFPPADSDSSTNYLPEAPTPIGSVSPSDLESWIDGHTGDISAHAEALAIAGLVTADPDQIRDAIERDPRNPHLLYIGATEAEFSDQERLEMSDRFHREDSENALAAYLYAANLLKSGNTEVALEVLETAADRPEINDFATSTMFLMEDAYLATGHSPDEATTLSFSHISLPYLTDLLGFAGSLQELESTLSTDEASELRSRIAYMGMHVSGQSKPNTILQHLTGLALEQKTLSGLPGDSPSPYENLTVIQAKEAIQKEQQQIREVLSDMPDLVDLMESHPGLVSRYYNRVLVLGELEALKWIKQQVK